MNIPMPPLSDQPDYIGSVYGAEQVSSEVPTTKKVKFAPWHHPVKQIVRDYQWGELTTRLVSDRPENSRSVLRYFTLPGADLLDIRFLSKKLESHGSSIEYFGFDQGHDGSRDSGVAYFSAESALRQAGKTTANAIVLPDRLEDIAIQGSQAANQLRQQAVFDVVNIDACDHLGFVPKGRDKSLFDALNALLAHQLRSERPWLLFLTTRASPTLLGAPTIRLQSAITDNISAHPDDFAKAVAECIHGTIQTLAGDLARSWSQVGTPFLTIFALGVAKYLLQFFHGQSNLPADVELMSVYAYRVHAESPDMLSLAFRITPQGMRVLPATAGVAIHPEKLELRSALAVIKRLSKLWLVDSELDDEEIKGDAVDGTIELLNEANYDIQAWRNWLSEHKIRPMTF